MWTACMILMCFYGGIAVRWLELSEMVSDSTDLTPRVQEFVIEKLLPLSWDSVLVSPESETMLINYVNTVISNFSFAIVEVFIMGSLVISLNDTTESIQVNLPIINGSTQVGTVIWGIRESSVPCLIPITVKSLYDRIANTVNHHGLTPHDEWFIVQLIPMSWDSVLIDMIENAPYVDQVTIAERDIEWRSDNNEYDDYKLSSLQNQTIGNHVGQYLRDFMTSQVDRIMSEAFLTGIQGETLAASGRLTDYMQGDEAKHIQSVNNCVGGLYIDARQFDESTGHYIWHVSMPIINDQNHIIGSITWGFGSSGYCNTHLSSTRLSDTLLALNISSRVASYIHHNLIDLKLHDDLMERVIMSNQKPTDWSDHVHILLLLSDIIIGVSVVDFKGDVIESNMLYDHPKDILTRTIDGCKGRIYIEHQHPLLYVSIPITNSYQRIIGVIVFALNEHRIPCIRHAVRESVIRSEITQNQILSEHIRSFISDHLIHLSYTSELTPIVNGFSDDAVVLHILFKNNILLKGIIVSAFGGESLFCLGNICNYSTYNDCSGDYILSEYERDSYLPSGTLTLPIVEYGTVIGSVQYHIELPISCLISKCGRLSECIQHTCQCIGKYNMHSANFNQTHDCEAETASSFEQRVFWYVQGLLVTIGLFASTCTLITFQYNPALHSNMMKSFLCIFIPDFVFCGVYFLFHATNLMRGSFNQDGIWCAIVGVIHYGIVVATVSGPPIIACLSYHVVVKRRIVTRSVVYLVLTVPWVIGFICAIVANYVGIIGSYRGLYCFSSRWDHAFSGGFLFIILIISILITSISYTFIYNHVKLTNNRAVCHDTNQRGRLRSISKRGTTLVLILIVCWFPFALGGFLNFMNVTPPVYTEMIGALIVSLQPLLDAYVLFKVPSVYNGMIQKLHQTSQTRSEKQTKKSQEMKSNGDIKIVLPDTIDMI